MLPLKQQHRKAAPLALVLLLLALLLQHVACVSRRNNTVVITQQAGASGDQQLLRALTDQAVTTIELASDYDVGSQFDGFEAPYKDAIHVNRNLTITAAPRLPQPPMLDLRFKLSVVELCDTCWLTMHDITITNDRQGANAQLDFVLGAGGSVVNLTNVVRRRLSCTAIEPALALVNRTSRAPRFPGPNGTTHQVFGAQDVVWRGELFPRTLHLVNYSVEFPRHYNGGYSMLLRNVFRMCLNFVDNGCLQEREAEVCVVEQIQALRASSGQLAPAAIAGIVVAAVVAATLLAAGLVFLLLRRRRRGRRALSKVPSASGHSRGPQPGDVDLEQGSGCSSSKRNTTGSSDSCARCAKLPGGDGGDGSLRSAPRSGALYEPSLPPGGSIADLHFGALLGTGSFGRVYKARWGDRDVAVKVIEHDSRMAPAVANEVSLMLSCKHPNVVCAYHYVCRTPGSRSQHLGSCAPLQAGGSGGSQHGLEQRSSSAGASGPTAAVQQLLQQMQQLDGGGGGGSGSGGGGSRDPNSIAVPVIPGPGPRHSRPPPAAQLAPQQPPLQLPASYDLVLTHASAGSGGSGRGRGAGSGGSGRGDAAAGPADQAGEQPQQLGADGSDAARACKGGGDAGGGSSLALPPCTPLAAAPQPGAAAAGSSEERGFWPAGPLALEEVEDDVQDTMCTTWLIQEYCDAGTLSKLSQAWSPAQEDDGQMLKRLCLLQDVARGLAYLHKRNVVHGDLNARNVLITSCPPSCCGYMAKLADLGLSRTLQQHNTHHTTCTVGTMSHMPPELLRHGRMSPQCDVYAYGVMMWEVYMREVAFRELHYGQFFETVVLRNQRPRVPPGCSMPDDYRLLMERCWSADPVDRPSTKALLECLGLMIADRQHSLGLPINSSLQTIDANFRSLSSGSSGAPPGLQHLRRSLADSASAGTSGGFAGPAGGAPGSGGAAGPQPATAGAAVEDRSSAPGHVQDL